MKKITTAYLLFTVCIAQSCGMLSKTPTVNKQTFTFDYSPKTSSKSGSAGMVLAFAEPYYANSFASSSIELFKSFKQSLGNDIEELIISKGFTMKGPYSSIDEMVFEDKKRTDIVIQIEIIPDFSSTEGEWKSNIALIGQPSYSYIGKTSLVGKINITGIEPLTNEKIWSKSVLIPKEENIMIQSSNKYSRPLVGSELYEDAGIYNAVGKALQNQYGGIMDKISAHFSPEEFISLKAQIKELKSKKGF
jgi:hypothetical protein